jgi:hypothetical protein
MRNEKIPEESASSSNDEELLRLAPQDPVFLTFLGGRASHFARDQLCLRDPFDTEFQCWNGGSANWLDSPIDFGGPGAPSSCANHREGQL